MTALDDQRTNLPGRFGDALRKTAHFSGNDSETWLIAPVTSVNDCAACASRQACPTAPVS